MEESQDNPTNDQPGYKITHGIFTAEQQQQLAQEFNLDNFQLIAPPEEEGYVRVVLPENVGGAVRALRINLLQDSMASIDMVSGIVDSVRNLDQSIRDYATEHNLSEEEEIALRQTPDAEKFFGMLGATGEESADQRHTQAQRSHMHGRMLLNLHRILTEGLSHAMSTTFDKFYFDRLKELRTQGKDGDYIEVILHEEVKKGQRPYDRMKDLINPTPESMDLATKTKVGNNWEEACRFAVYDSKDELVFKHPEDLLELQDASLHVIKGELPQIKFP